MYGWYIPECLCFGIIVKIRSQQYILKLNNPYCFMGRQFVPSNIIFIVGTWVYVGESFIYEVKQVGPVLVLGWVTI